MKKRIVKNNFIISFLACALAVCTCIIIYTLYMQETMYKQVQSQTQLLKHILETTPEDNFTILYDVEGLSNGRVTYIYHDGLVTYDSHYDINNMETHSDRPEIIEALDTGISIVQRYSATSGESTYYCAARVGDGSVVRIGVTTNDIFKNILMETSPLTIVAVIVIVLMCYMISGVTTRRIVDNIENYDIESGGNNIYEELFPFINKIRGQNEIIGRQVQSLTEEKTKLQSIFNNVQEGIIVFNSSSEIIQINPEAMQLFCIEDSAPQAVDSIPVKEIKDALSDALRGETAQAIFRQGEKWYQCMANPNIYGGDHGAIVIVMDITGQVENERQRRKFTDNITHELKTPLTNILGYSQLITNNMAKEDDVQGFASIIENNAADLLDMIDNIISISKLETEEMIDKQPVELDAIVLDSILRQEPAIQAKCITVNKKIQPVTVIADEGRMYQMVDNLVSNAVKYNKAGGAVTVCLAVAGNDAVLTVEDTGIGIAPEEHERIFERFYVVDKSRNKSISSTGLGLSIVKHIVKLHNGHIAVKSVPNKGTKFTVTLPLQIK